MGGNGALGLAGGATREHDHRPPRVVDRGQCGLIGADAIDHEGNDGCAGLVAGLAQGRGGRRRDDATNPRGAQYVQQFACRCATVEWHCHPPRAPDPPLHRDVLGPCGHEEGNTFLLEICRSPEQST